MGSFRGSSISAIVCTLAAFIFCVVGMFSNVWWQQYVPNNDKTFGLFTVLNCTNDLCVLAPEGTSNEDFIVFEQAAALVQFIMLLVSGGFQVVGFILGTPILVIAASGALGLACFSSVLQVSILSVKYFALTHAYMITVEQPMGFSSVLQVSILSVKYFALTHAYMITVQQPMGYVIYKTLPMGLLAISGSLCTPAFVCLVIYRTEERRMRLKEAAK